MKKVAGVNKLLKTHAKIRSFLLLTVNSTKWVTRNNMPQMKKNNFRKRKLIFICKSDLTTVACDLEAEGSSREGLKK